MLESSIFSNVVVLLVGIALKSLSIESIIHANDFSFIYCDFISVDLRNIQIVERDKCVCVCLEGEEEKES